MNISNIRLPGTNRSGHRILPPPLIGGFWLEKARRARVSLMITAGRIGLSWSVKNSPQKRYAYTRK